MASPTQLSGGSFQDTQGNLLADGYLLMELSQDAQANTSTEICAGYEVKITLNSSGSVDTSTAQYVWGNDNLTPAGTFYIVRGYTAAGQLVWGPNSQQVVGSSPFDVGTWVPGSVNVASNVVSGVDLQTNGVNNGSQIKLNLVAGTNVSLTDDGTGDVTVAAHGQSFGAFLLPSLTTTQKNAIASPAAGLVVFDTTLGKLCVYTGAAWQTITSS